MRSTWHIAAVVAAVLAAVVGMAVAVVALTGGRDRVAGPRPAPTTVTASTTARPASPSRGTGPAGTPAPSRTGGSASPTGGPAAPGVPRGLLGKDVEVIATGQRVVALTFDAGSNADGLPAILRTLAAERVTATFFLTGDFAARHPDSVRAVVAAGHRLGNHSATHPYFTKLSDDAIRAELTGGRSRILSAGGTDTRPLFRFPYGDRNARTIAAVNAAGYVAVRWTVDTLGWKGTSGGISAQTVVDRGVANARAGEIVLMHVGSHPDDHSTLDADALPALIAQLRAKGYGFTTLDALLP